MREKLENMYWAWEMNVADKIEGMYYKWKYNFVENFVKDEEGDSNMVAVVVLIVIVIAVAGVFRESLETAVKTVMERFTNFVGK